ncbi:hypothetical protein [Arhodomonas sp. AD133]|uniref:hypothetical protein n=1 Tax=Arhodomonas sp. AD133 TaxID=3415009 RepID=UPI003EBCCD24
MDEDRTPEPGVFIVEGMKIRIPSLTLSFDHEGRLVSGPLELQTGLDQTPVWLEIAFEHACTSQIASLELAKAVDDGRNEEIGQSLVSEMKAGMQAISCSCTAVDAFHANVKELISIPEKTKAAWKQNGTARYRQISEVLRLAFPMSNRRAAYIRQALRQNFTWRDQATHPSSTTLQPAVHETLNKATDRRFVLFRHYNAREIARLSFNIVYWASQNPPTSKFKDLREYCNTLKGRLQGLGGAWDERFGAQETAG